MRRQDTKTKRAMRLQGQQETNHEGHHETSGRERPASGHPSELGTPLGRRSHWPNSRAPIAFERNAIVHMAELSGIIACRTAKSESAIV
jgi:hypothetical protein